LHTRIIQEHKCVKTIGSQGFAASPTLVESYIVGVGLNAFSKNPPHSAFYNASRFGYLQLVPKENSVSIHTARQLALCTLCTGLSGSS